MLREQKCKRPACHASGDVRLGDYCSTECEIRHMDEIEINDLRTEVERLRAAVANHRRRVVIDPQPWDRDLWAALDG